MVQRKRISTNQRGNFHDHAPRPFRYCGHWNETVCGGKNCFGSEITKNCTETFLTCFFPYLPSPHFILLQQCPIAGRSVCILLPLLGTPKGRRKGCRRRRRTRFVWHLSALRHPHRSCACRSNSRIPMVRPRCRNPSRIDLPRILRRRLHARR